MEHAQRDEKESDLFSLHCQVLILILMEHAQRVTMQNVYKLALLLS